MAGSNFAYGTDSINGALNFRPAVPSQDPAQDMLNALNKLVAILAPPQICVEIPFVNLAVNAQLPTSGLSLNNQTFNAIMCTCVGNNAQLNVYLNAADPSSQPPDFAFLSGYPTSILYFPVRQIGSLTVVSAGSNPASGNLFLMQY